MKRKLRATNLKNGNFRYESHRACSRFASVKFCSTCHAYGYRDHYTGCTDNFVEISAAAQIPKRTASVRVWSFFIRKFVDKEFLKEKLGVFNKKHTYKRKNIYVSKVLNI